MSDIPDKAPIKHEHIVDRSNTVSGLLDDTIRGIKAGDRPISVADLAQSASGSWEKLFNSAKESLKQRSLLYPSSEKQAQSRALLGQLEGLNKLDPESRTTLLHNLVDNEKQFSAFEAYTQKVREALRAGYMPAVIEQQQKAIASADAVNKKALKFELTSMEQAASNEKDGSNRSLLEKALEDLRTSMATPFIERCRLSAFLSNEGKLYQAEKMLDEALKTQIPSEALESQFVKDLRKNAGDQLLRLRVENNLLEVYDTNLAKMDIQSRDGVVTQDELNSARAKGGDDSFRALTDFLSENYKHLTRKHWALFGKEGITRSDIVDYEKERATKINDLKL